MQQLGQILVFATFALTAVAAVLALGGAAAGDRRRVRASRHAVMGVWWVNVAMSLVLLHQILSHDFSNKYVASYTDSGMPLFYLLTAFWGGEKGALMFWVVSLSALAAALVRIRRDDDSPYFGYVNGINALALLFFDALMVFASNPFEGFLTFEGPADGSGLNPLLQNPLMAIHPPLQLAGFVAYTIPFAFALGALLAGVPKGKWLDDARRWSLFAWATLTAGLIIGGLWAYVELGWGGFWGWDPVENAALLPWLSGTALVHSASTEQRRGLYRRWNIVLVSLTFLLTIFATFLTRSQLISSLHSFSNSVLTPFFLWYMVGLVAAVAALLAWRWRSLESADRIPNLWCRESLVLINNVLFLVAIFIVLWGTLLPKLSESPVVLAFINGGVDLLNRLTGKDFQPLTQAINVGPEWFNKVVAPVGLLILALTAIGPLVPLRSARGKAVPRALGWTFLPALVAGLAVAAVFVVARATDVAATTGMGLGEAAWRYAKGMGLEGVYGLLAIVFAAWVVAAVLLDWGKSVAVRRVVTREGRFGAAWGLFLDNPKRYGGHLVHLGVALSFLGFAGGAGKIIRKDVVLHPTERLSVAGRTLVYLGTEERWHADGQFASVQSKVLVHPRGEGLPEGAVEAIRASAPGAVEVAVTDAPEVNVRFASPEKAAEFFVTVYGRTVLARDLKVASSDAGKREVRFAPFQLETVRVVPGSFHRMVEEVKSAGAALGGDRLQVRTGRGDPLILVTAKDDAAFQALLAGTKAGDASPWAAVRRVPERPDEVRIVPAGAGRVLSPEVRFYVKSEQPTSEVAIDAAPLVDLYLAASPGEGSEAINLTAMVNPLMNAVWLGAVVLIFSGLLLTVPLRRRATPAPEPRAQTAEEGA